MQGAFGAGPTALQRREGTLRALEASVHATLNDGRPAVAGDLTTKAILGGIREVTASRLRDGRQDDLPGLAGAVSGWAACYPTRLPEGLEAPVARPHDPEVYRGLSARARRAEGRLPRRSELPRQAIVKSQRERIVDATAAIVAERGLEGLTIGEIVSRASVSNQTFYSIYDSKQDAFLGTQKVGLHQALNVCAKAYESRRGDWPTAVAAGIGALLGYLASEPAHARLSLVQIYGAGPEALAIRDASMRAFGFYLSAHAPLARPPLQAAEIVPESRRGWDLAGPAPLRREGLGRHPAGRRPSAHLFRAGAIPRLRECSRGGPAHSGIDAPWRLSVGSSRAAHHSLTLSSAPPMMPSRNAFVSFRRGSGSAGTSTPRKSQSGS